MPAAPCFCGGVPEWLDGTVSKTVVRASVPRVRIPPPPPRIFLFYISVLCEIRESQKAPEFRAFGKPAPRSEEHTSELQSLMRISYAVFCLKKKKNTQQDHRTTYQTKQSLTTRHRPQQ